MSCPGRRPPSSSLRTGSSSAQATGAGSASNQPWPTRGIRSANGRATWLELIRGTGFEAVQSAYLEVLEGGVDPKTAHVLTLG